MWEDPLVEEVHRTRERLAAQFNYDVHAIVADLRQRQEALGHKLVRLKKLEAPTAEVERSPRVLSPESTCTEKTLTS